MIDPRVLLKAAERFVVSNSPGILTGLGVAGTVSTAILTGRAAYRVGKEEYSTYEERDYASGITRGPKELVASYWKEFVPPAIVGATTIASIVLANRIGNNRAAAMAAAFQLSEQLTTEYRDKVKQVLGEKKEEMMRSDIATERMNNSKNVIVIGSGDVLFYDEWSDRWFMSNLELVKKAANEINHQINNYYHASVAEFYDKIGLSPTRISEQLGWNSDTQLEVEYTTCISPTGVPAINIRYNKDPIGGYDRLS